MDPFVVFDCQQVVPDRFALALSAAARSRALLRGAQPRLAGSGKRATEVALREIAGGAFSRAELAPFLRVNGSRRAVPKHKLCDSARASGCCRIRFPLVGNGKS
jgi:DNA-directed RNA polymerase subunit omega